MSNDQKPAPKPEIKPAPDYGKTIAVKCVTFYQPHPDFGARSSIAAESAANKGLVVIEFVPALRHHRVETHAPDRPARVRFIHEVHVASWEPLA